MGGIFSSPPPVVVQQPQQFQSSGSGEVKPYAPVEPFIEDLLPRIEEEFAADPVLFQQSLVPQDTAETLAARQGFANLGQTAAGFAPDFQQLYQADLARGMADPSQDPLFLAETGAIADQARRLTERDKLLAQEQAIQAGQFGLGSTALAELQQNQQRLREETVQRQLAESLGRAEQRRIGAADRAPGFAQQQLQAQLAQPSLQEAVGRDIESREAARLADQARLTQQPQEAQREQLINLSNLLGGLAGLGTSTTFQNQSSGFTSQAFSGGPSPFQQIASAAAAAAPFVAASDIRLKTNVKQVGKLNNGIKLYTWNWTEEGKDIAGDQAEYGVIAQEVMEVVPEAVIEGNDGYLRVSYETVYNHAESFDHVCCREVGA
tara:strand:- start:1187 stop:2320 length:1134 start_codon:yes stop_codon:yes gene_type:complete